MQGIYDIEKEFLQDNNILIGNPIQDDTLWSSSGGAFTSSISKTGNRVFSTSSLNGSVTMRLPKGYINLVGNDDTDKFILRVSVQSSNNCHATYDGNGITHMVSSVFHKNLFLILDYNEIGSVSLTINNEGSSNDNGWKLSFKDVSLTPVEDEVVMVSITNLIRQRDESIKDISDTHDKYVNDITNSAKTALDNLDKLGKVGNSDAQGILDIMSDARGFKDSINNAVTTANSTKDTVDKLTIKPRNLANRSNTTARNADNGARRVVVSGTKKAYFNIAGSDSSYSGINIYDKNMKNNTDYVLGFDITPTGGSLKNVGGHITDFSSYDNSEFFINGVLQSGEWDKPTDYSFSNNTTYHITLKATSGNVHTGTESNLGLHINPNRGLTTSVEGYIENIMLQYGTMDTGYIEPYGDGFVYYASSSSIDGSTDFYTGLARMDVTSLNDSSNGYYSTTDGSATSSLNNIISNEYIKVSQSDKIYRTINKINTNASRNGTVYFHFYDSNNKWLGSDKILFTDSFDNYVVPSLGATSFRISAQVGNKDDLSYNLNIHINRPSQSINTAYPAFTGSSIVDSSSYKDYSWEPYNSVKLDNKAYCNNLDNFSGFSKEYPKPNELINSSLNTLSGWYTSMTTSLSNNRVSLTKSSVTTSKTFFSNSPVNEVVPVANVSYSMQLDVYVKSGFKDITGSSAFIKIINKSGTSRHVINMDFANCQIGAWNHLEGTAVMPNDVDPNKGIQYCVALNLESVGTVIVKEMKLEINNHCTTVVHNDDPSRQFPLYEGTSSLDSSNPNDYSWVPTKANMEDLVSKADNNELSSKVSQNYFSLYEWRNKPNLVITNVPAMKITLEPNTSYTLSTNIPTRSGDSQKRADVYFASGSPSLLDTANNGATNNNPRTVLSDKNGLVTVGIINKDREILEGKWWVRITKDTPYSLGMPINPMDTSRIDFEKGELTLMNSFTNYHAAGSTHLQYFRLGNFCVVSGTINNGELIGQDTSIPVAKLPSHIRVMSTSRLPAQASSNDIFLQSVFGWDYGDNPNCVAIERTRGGNGIRKDYNAGRWLNFTIPFWVTVDPSYYQ